MFFSLNLRPIIVSLQRGLLRLAEMAKGSVNIHAVVRPIESCFKLLSVVNAGGIGRDSSGQLEEPVRFHGRLVVKVPFPVIFGPIGICILLPAFRRLPVSGRSLLIDQFTLVAAEILLLRRHYSRINDLSAPGQVAVRAQLDIQPVEEGRLTARANPILKTPHHGAVRNIRRLRRVAKMLKTRLIQLMKFDPFICQIVHSRLNQNLHHGISRVGNAGRPPFVGTARGTRR